MYEKLLKNVRFEERERFEREIRTLRDLNARLTAENEKLLQESEPQNNPEYSSRNNLILLENNNSS